MTKKIKEVEDFSISVEAITMTQENSKSYQWQPCSLQ